MGEQPRIKPLDLRKAVPEWVAQGMAVRIGPDGTIEVRPSQAPQSSDVEIINWKAFR